MVDVAPVAEFAVVGPWVRHVSVTVPTPPDVADVNTTFDDPSINVTVSPSTGEVIWAVSTSPRLTVIAIESLAVAPTSSVAVTVTVCGPSSRNIKATLSPVAVFFEVSPANCHVRIGVPDPPVVDAVNVNDDPITVAPLTGDVIDTLSGVVVPVPPVPLLAWDRVSDELQLNKALNSNIELRREKR